MRIPILPRALAIAMLALAALLSSQVRAELYGVAHDIAGNEESLVRISAMDASITDEAQVALTGCCRVSGSLVASDDGNRTVYFVTPGTAPAAAWQLHRLSLQNGGAVTSNLPTNERIAAILRQPATATLYGLSDSGAGLRLVSISDAGLISPIGAPLLADCCAVRVGVAALSGDGSRIAFVARLQAAANDPALRLFVVDSATGALISNAVLQHAPDILLGGSGGSFAAVYHDAGSEFFGTIGTDGTITAVGSGLVNCCEVATGVGASDGNLLRFVGRNLGADGFSLIEVDTSTGAFQVLGALDAGYAIHGLVESTVNLPSDLIFQDGFEVIAPLGTQQAAAAAHAAGLAAAASGPRELPTNQTWSLYAANARDVASTTASANSLGSSGNPARSAVELRGNAPAAVPVPLGNFWLWSVLAALLALAAMLYHRRVSPNTRGRLD